MKDVDKNTYATVSTDEGVNYREIADTMTDIGYPMNHSSARNYLLRIMKKFVKKLSDNWGLHLSDNKIDEISRSPTFQNGMSEILMSVEMDRRDNR